ncbi:MAG: chromosomal replication initiator protein DnaA [Cellvibrionales bacterium]|nr:chromosomal replication initiator protein DnaA [Cellvibrionales bacterium]
MVAPTQQDWKHCTARLQRELPEIQFNTWIRPLHAVGRGGQLWVLAPNRFIRDWVAAKFLMRLQEVMDELSAERIDLQLGLKENFHSQWVLPPPVPPPAAVEDSKSTASAAPSPTPQAAAPKTALPPSNSALNHRFTFDSFVEGESNGLALAAAQHAAENPGTGHNPLFIYGGVGLGKTHLMQAVGHVLRTKRPEAKVLYVHAERFVIDMVQALRLNTINDFKRHYRSCHALLVDDVQFFAGKERSQDEFFHTFNSLLDNGQQMVFTCDHYPKEIDGLDERIRSRLGWGLVATIEPPKLETRAAILMKKATEEGVAISSETVFFIAERVRSNVRELEGVLKRVKASAYLRGHNEVGLELAKESLRDILAVQARQVTTDNIQKVVADYFKIRRQDLLSKSRKRSVVRPRQLAMHLAKELTNHSLPEIGDAFGGRDHTTVLHACRKIQQLAKDDRDMQEDLQNLHRTLNS